MYTLITQLTVYLGIEWRPICVHALWTRLLTRLSDDSQLLYLKIVLLIF